MRPQTQRVFRLRRVVTRGHAVMIVLVLARFDDMFIPARRLRGLRIVHAHVATCRILPDVRCICFNQRIKF